MSDVDPILEMVGRHRTGQRVGLYSVCSAHPFVLRAAARHAADVGSVLLVEATCNQVNQFGGYTGMKPADFVSLVQRLVRREGLPAGRLHLGGDHLGPSPWRDEPRQIAMEKARTLVESFVRAGYRKLHLDASMACADDPRVLAGETIAQRTAVLAEVAERAWREETGSGNPPVYVVGTEVPPPGGITDAGEALHVTRPEEVDRTVALNRSAFQRLGLEEAWERVLAVVVQPGVEFGNDSILEYDRTRAAQLSAAIETIPRLVYEAHSTDYQKPEALRQLVEDHFCILKVGPWLTFAMREGLLALAAAEEEMLPGRDGADGSRLRQVIDAEMLKDRAYWEKYYQGDGHALAFQRIFSFSDRIRYYWQRPSVQRAVDHLISNLSAFRMPLSLISQYLPDEFRAIRAGTLPCIAEELILHRIRGVLSCYSEACRPNGREESPLIG